VNARLDQLLQRVADTLELEIVRTPEGGEFGAAFVRGVDGEISVLKAAPDAKRYAAWAHGVSLAERLRHDAYPAPAYRGCGIAGDAVWSLQEVLPGAVPVVMSAAHAVQLLGLAERHAGRAAGVTPREKREPDVQRSMDGARWLQQHLPTRALGREVEAVLDRLAPTPLPRTDICHGDFHHRNFLAREAEVSGVFDWEGASCGDWRFDVASLAFWSCVASSQVAPEAAALILARTEDVCDEPALALYGATLSMRAVGFYMATHPEWVDDTLASIDLCVAQWWRT
jgi:aminoglycoside phosphotransferase (APT) family kinase protein